MKGQASYAFSMAEAAFTFILLMSVFYSAGNYTSGYFKEKLIDIRADRVENAATVLDDYPAGSLKLDLEDYHFKVDGSNFSMKYADVNESRNLSNLSYSGLDGPSEFENFERFCIEKNFQQELVFRSCQN